MAPATVVRNYGWRLNKPAAGIRDGPGDPPHKERETMKQSVFYLAMVAGMLAIVIAIGFNGYANWTAVECTTVYYTEDAAGATLGMAHHTCFNRDGVIELGTGLDFDHIITLKPVFPPLGE